MSNRKIESEQAANVLRKLRETKKITPKQREALALAISLLEARAIDDSED